MPDMGAIAAAIGSLKTAGELAKGMLNIRDTAMIQGKVIELQAEILAAQTSALSANSDQFLLLERIRDLETKMAKLEAWDAEKKRYALTDYGAGTFAYALKPEAANGEPFHRACPNCYGDGRISVLQQYSSSESRDYCECPRCKSRFTLGRSRNR